MSEGPKASSHYRYIYIISISEHLKVLIQFTTMQTTFCTNDYLKDLKLQFTAVQIYNMY